MSTHQGLFARRAHGTFVGMCGRFGFDRIAPFLICALGIVAFAASIPLTVTGTGDGQLRPVITGEAYVIDGDAFVIGPTRFRLKRVLAAECNRGAAGC